ncbi:Putative protein-S-isoprenylcysteine methyltransferase [hydrothermal vent metagenome]|uniref:Isoprenylcysteine carboxylmethyltransferase family protein n=1 Tax=hydrothermal vent metagenome TaxID=652676 RepID=A0A3B0TJ23_9ZZZZ
MTLGQFQKLRRLVLAVLLGLVFVGLLYIRPSWGDENVHEAVEAVGVGLIAIGIVGRMWCTLYIGGRKSVRIVTQGPYSATRNPLYVFSSIAAAGLGAQTGSITVALLFVAGCAVAFHIVILREEEFLEREFGAPYRVYKSNTPRFVPNFSKFSDLDELVVVPRKIYSTFFDGLIFFVGMPVLEYVEYLQDEGVLVPLLLLP